MCLAPQWGADWPIPPQKQRASLGLRSAAQYQKCFFAWPSATQAVVFRPSVSAPECGMERMAWLSCFFVCHRIIGTLHLRVTDGCIHIRVYLFVFPCLGSFGTPQHLVPFMEARCLPRSFSYCAPDCIAVFRHGSVPPSSPFAPVLCSLLCVASR